MFGTLLNTYCYKAPWVLFVVSVHVRRTLCSRSLVLVNLGVNYTLTSFVLVHLRNNVNLTSFSFSSSRNRRQSVEV